MKEILKDFLILEFLLNHFGVESKNQKGPVNKLELQTFVDIFWCLQNCRHMQTHVDICRHLLVSTKLQTRTVVLSHVGGSQGVPGTIELSPTVFWYFYKYWYKNIERISTPRDAAGVQHNIVIRLSCTSSRTSQRNLNVNLFCVSIFIIPLLQRVPVLVQVQVPGLQQAIIIIQSYHSKVPEVWLAFNQLRRVRH